MAAPIDPIECAKNGDLEYFKQVDLDVLRKARSPDHADSALGVAAMNSHFECCEEIYRRCPELLYTTSRFGSTALHQAAFNKAHPIVKLLIDASDQIELQHPVAGAGAAAGVQKLLTMVSYDDLTALHFAVRKDDLESTKLLIEADLDHTLLRMADKDGDTGMHVAVRKHNCGIVKLLIEADPGLEYCANLAGHTPLFIAFQEALTGDETRVRIRKMLLQNQPLQSKGRIGDNNWTLLHHATYKGDLSTIEEIVRLCPESLELVDNEDRNVFHLALKFEHVNVVKYLLGITTLPDAVLNGQDNNGNTPLHIAALGGSQSMTISLLYDSRVNKRIENLQGQKAIDSINFDYDKRKAGVYGVTDRVNEKEIKEQTDYDLLVGALIAAVTFTAGLTLPGGFISEGLHKGTAILAQRIPFKLFVISNTIALLLSLYAVFSHFCTKHLLKKEDIIYQLNVATFCTLGAIFAMVLAFILGSYAVLAFTDELAITVCALCCCFFLLAFHTMSRMAIQRRRFAR